MAMALRPSLAASRIRSLGSDAPSRKLKDEWQCSSAHGIGRGFPGSLVTGRAREASWRSESLLGGMAIGFCCVDTARRSGPGERPGRLLDELPEAVLLDLVVEPAQPAEVAGAGSAALVVRDGVVQVAPPDRLPAGREPAGPVARDDVLPQPGRWPVTRAFLPVRAASSRGPVHGGLLVGSLGCQDGCPERASQDRGQVLVEPPGQAVPGDGQGYPSDEPLLSAGTGLATGLRHRGHRFGPALRVRHDDPPSHGRVTGSQVREVANLGGGDRADPAQVPGLARVSVQRRPRQLYVNQPTLGGPQALHRRRARRYQRFDPRPRWRRSRPRAQPIARFRPHWSGSIPGGGVGLAIVVHGFTIITPGFTIVAAVVGGRWRAICRTAIAGR